MALYTVGSWLLRPEWAHLDGAAQLRAWIEWLESENSRLLKLLERSPQQAALPAPTQSGAFEAHPGVVDRSSSPEAKLAFYQALFSARSDVYALRWHNTRTGRSGWVPAVRGGWRKGVRRDQQDHLPLTAEVLRAHLTGTTRIGLYPLLDGDTCCWLAADFDGTAAMLDALAYLKAARTVNLPAGLEVSQSGLGAHVWLFFTEPVPAATARALGAGLLREAMTVRGHMSLTNYDRLFPAQDVLPAGGIGNLIAAPLHGGAKRRGAALFLDLATMEPHDDQWAYLSSLGRITPRELERAARRCGRIQTGAAVREWNPPASTRVTVPTPPQLNAGMEAGIGD